MTTTPPAPSKKRGAEEADDAERATRATPSPRGQKREAEEEANDKERAERDKENKRLPMSGRGVTQFILLYSLCLGFLYGFKYPLIP